MLVSAGAFRGAVLARRPLFHSLVWGPAATRAVVGYLHLDLAVYNISQVGPRSFEAEGRASAGRGRLPVSTNSQLSFSLLVSSWPSALLSQLSEA